MYNSFGKYKTTNRVQVFLGLCMVCCFILCSSNHITKADNFYQYSWGSYDQSGNPFQIFNTTGLNVFDMITYLYGEDNTSGKHPSYTPDVRFYDTIYNLGLEPALTFFDTSAPPFYVNLYCFGSNGVLLVFCKNNSFFSEDNYSFVRNNSGNYVFSTGNNIIYSDNINIDYPFLAYRTPQIISNSLNSNGDSFALLEINRPTNDNVFELHEGTYTSNGSIRSYKFYHGWFGGFQDVSSYFSEWLNGDYQFLFIDVSHNDGSLYRYMHHISFDCYAYSPVTNCSYRSSDFSARHPILSTIYTYSINSDFSIGGAYNKYLKCNDNNADNPIGNIISYGIDRRSLGNLPTPIPYPTQYWYTPTPYPTVILDPTLTPIGFFGDTDIVINTGDLWGDIKGNLGIFNEWFATNPFPVFFAGTADLIYSFNPIFKFLMIIPITALIAMVIGRLRRK